MNKADDQARRGGEPLRFSPGSIRGALAKSNQKPKSSEEVISTLEAEDWPELHPLTSSQSNPFPLETLRGELREYIEALSKYSSTPPEIATFCCLALINGATLKKVRIQSGKGRTMPATLQVLSILPSGDGKSTVFETPCDALRKVQRRRRDRAKELKRAGAARIAELEDQLKGLPKDDQDYPTLAGELRQLESEAGAAAPTLLTSDPSSEALEEILYENNGCIIVASAEPRETLEAAAGSHRNGSANIKPYLCGFSGESWQTLRLCRQGREIASPSVTAILLSQPSTMERLQALRDFVERGFLARFVIVFPPPSSDIPPSPWERQGMPGNLVDFWERLINALTNISAPVAEDGEPIPFVIQMSPQARNRAVEFFYWTQEASRGEGPLASIPQSGKRLAEIAQRIAAALHLSETILRGNPWEIAIDEDTYVRATQITRWTIESILEAHFSTLGVRSVKPGHVKVWEAVKKIGRPIIKTRDVHRKLQHLPEFRTSAPVRDALRTLEEMNYLREIEPGPATRGRPSESYLVRPSELGMTKRQNPGDSYRTTVSGVTPANDKPILSNDTKIQPGSTADASGRAPEDFCHETKFNCQEPGRQPESPPNQDFASSVILSSDSQRLIDIPEMF